MMAARRRAVRPRRKIKKRGSRKRLVFITHSSLDTGIAQLLAEKVTECGAEYFLDHDHLEGGDQYNEVIRTNLAKAHELVVLLTPWANKSSYVWSELGAAWVRKLRIAVVLQGLTVQELRVT